MKSFKITAYITAQDDTPKEEIKEDLQEALYFGLYVEEVKEIIVEETETDHDKS